MHARDLALRLGLDRSGRSWRGTCPACDYPRAFAVRPGKEDAPLLFCANGCRREDLRTALHTLGASLPPPTRRTAGKVPHAGRRQGAALRLAEGCTPALGTLADIYLTTRALPGLASSIALRFHCAAPHPEGGTLPALVALVANADGVPVAVHRTYLTPDGRGKAKVTPDRASLGPIWGGAIRLHDPTPDGAIVIGEGIETSASAGRLIGLPAWAALSAGNLARALVLPASIRRVIIAVDPDPPGRAAAQQAAERWLQAGLRVELATPSGPGDFNDILRARGADHAG